MVLTVFAIDKAKPAEKPYRLSDGKGLALQVEPNGSKLWRFRYRFSGKENMLTLGPYPDVSLAHARDKRDEARKLLAAGTDPSQKRKDEKHAAATSAGNTFGCIAADYIEKMKAEGAAETTLSKNRWLLEELARPIAHRPISEVNPAEILAVLKQVEKTGRRETARRLRGTIGSVYRFAIANLKAESDPTYPLRGALLTPIVQHRPAITEEAGLGALWHSITEYDGWPTLKAALQLTMLTMCRPGEVRLMTKREIIWPKAKWEIPAERMKMRRPHDVPLSSQALAVLREVWELFPESELVLPSIRSWRKPLSENALNSALRRMGYSKDEVTSHGFRASASTILNEKGYSPDVIEAALAHEDSNKIRAAYNRARYWAERQAMLQDWADLLDSLKSDQSSSKSVA